MEGQKPLFSIFIPTWNNLPFLRLCVESIEKNSAYPHEILIHVNDGQDGTLDWVKARGYKHTHSKENIGVCWAMNGLRPLMTTDYVVYINDDMYMCPGWDSALHDEIGRQKGKMWYLASTLIEPGARLRCYPSHDFGMTVEEFREQELLDTYRSLAPDDWQGALFPPTVVHRDVWDLVGGYSVEFSPGMASDPDFNAKLWMAGVRVFKGLGSSVGYHFKNRSVNRIVKNDGPIQFLRKWGITIRAFRYQFMHVDRPWTEAAALDRGAIRTERIRSYVKRVFTVFKDMKAATLWNPMIKPGDE